MHTPDPTQVTAAQAICSSPCTARLAAASSAPRSRRPKCVACGARASAASSATPSGRASSRACPRRGATPACPPSPHSPPRSPPSKCRPPPPRRLPPRRHPPRRVVRPLRRPN
eukprot:2003119-Prymnesium_polylepis.1